HFELARARKGALDAVAHRRNLATDGLTDGHDGFLCDVFRFSEAERDFRHGARHHAHFLAAPDENCDAPKEQDRAEDADRQPKEFRRGSDAVNAKVGYLVAKDAVAERDAKAGPGEGNE